VITQELQTVLPKVDKKVSTVKYARFEIGPLESGFGITLGNALRRVLLSALPGAAVTSMRIAGVYHEFSVIEGAREDTTQLILRLKQLRLRMHRNEPVRIFVNKKGPGVITAADLNAPPEVEIINPDLELLTLDSPDAEVDIELVVEMGKGFLPAEDESRPKLPIGEIPIDAIFSPVRRVKYSVEPTRVGGHTDFDRLVLEIWTDGTMHPEDALTESVRILVNLFSLIGGIDLAYERQEEDASPIPQHIAEISIDDLGLSVRAFNSLKRAGLSTVGDVLLRLQEGESNILSIRNFGQKSFDELIERLAEQGYLDYIDYTPGE
jgi:DNA-directed RNA polymerase subunit alpha